MISGNEKSESRSKRRRIAAEAIVLIGAMTLLGPLRFGVPQIWPGFEGFRVAFVAGFFGALLTACWWLLRTEVPKRERWGSLAVGVIALILVSLINHRSMGFMWLVYVALPLLALARIATAWLATSRRRWQAWLVALVLCFAPWTLLRLEGLTGDHAFHFTWRFGAESSRFADRDPGDGSIPMVAPIRWSGFRGADRDGVVSSEDLDGLRIDPDWARSPPTLLWRRPVGAGWSSFAIAGDMVITQEQRDAEEWVAAYDLRTGRPIWHHSDAVRFEESMGGAGPRATPTVTGGRVYSLGATGVLNALDTRDGARVWSRRVDSEGDVDVPIWGFSASPAVVGDRVIVAAAGRLLAFASDTGALLWRGPDLGPSYSSPHHVLIRDREQIVQLGDEGAAGVGLDGRQLWSNDWSGTSLVQPAILPDGDLLISAGEGRGVRRIAVMRKGTRWTTMTRWTSHRLKPNFNDFVIHGDHAYGFDGLMLAAIDLETGARVWKGGRYGHGQLVLLPDQGLLLVLTEKGELALVDATPDGFTARAQATAIEGKTWNHPALVHVPSVGLVLLVRNGQEMAALLLAATTPSDPALD